MLLTYLTFDLETITFFFVLSLSRKPNPVR